MSDKREQFTQFICSLMVAQGNQRQEFEKVYFDLISTQPEEIYQALLYVGTSLPQKDVRSFSLVLLRIDVTKNAEKWIGFSEPSRQFIQGSLMSSIESEEDDFLRGCLREVLIPLSESMLDDKDTWPNLLPWLLGMAQSETNQKESALLILAHIIPYYKVFFDDDNNFMALLHIIQETLNANFPKVGISSLKLLSTFSQLYVKKPNYPQIQKLINNVTQMIRQSLTLPNQNFLQITVKLLIDLAESDPNFFKPCAREFVAEILSIIETPNIHPDSLKLCVEFLVVFTENKPNLVANIDGFIPKFVDILLMMMVDLKDLDMNLWNKNFDIDEEEFENSDVAQSGLDRIACAIEGNLIVSKVFEDDRIPAWISNENWKFRTVSLMAMSSIAEGCKALLIHSLDQIIPLIMSVQSDPHPRVRYALAMLLGLFSSELVPTFQKKCHKSVIPCLINLISDFHNPKVQAAALSSIVSYIRYLGRKETTFHLDSLVSSILEVLNKSNHITTVMEHALTALGQVAASSGDNFSKFYDLLIPSLKVIVDQATSEDLKLLRGKAIECYVMIGNSAGKEIFQKDVSHLMNVLSTLELNALDFEDPLHLYVIRAWMTISVCLGEDFAPYLKYVVPLLIKAASIPVMMTNKDSNEELEEGWDVIQIGQNYTAIHTAALSEKSQACNLLFIYASTLKSSFLPFITEVANLIVPHLTFTFDEEIRLSAFAIIPHLIEISLEQYKANQSEENRLFVTNLLAFILPKLIEAIRDQFDDESKAKGFETLATVVCAMGDDTLPEDQVQQIIGLICHEIDCLRKRATSILNKSKETDIDDNIVAKDELRNLGSLADEIAETIGGMVRTHTCHFITHSAPIIELAKSLVETKKIDVELKLAICIFADIVANVKEKSLFLFSYILPVFLSGLMSENEGVKQASSYAIGVCVEHGKDNFQISDIIEVTKILIMICQSYPQISTETKEASLSAIGRIIRQYFTSFPADFRNHVISSWLDGLPILCDTIEAPVAHAILCELIFNYCTDIMDQDWSNFPKILSIYGKILTFESHEEEFITPETKGQLREILLQIPREVLLQGLSYFSNEKDSSEMVSCLKTFLSL